MVVISSILVINQVSDYIWQSWFAHTPDELRYAKQVAKSLQSSLPSTLSGSDEIRIIDIDSVAWLPEQHAQLLSQEVIVTFDEDGAAFLNFMLADEARLIQLGPFSPTIHSNSRLYLFKLFSFVLLGLILIIWLKPLWHDLTQFKRITEQLAKGELDIHIQPSRFSAISDLTAQFHSMASEVARLMSEQQQLVNAVSHELRTPLARLKFAMAMLQSTAPEQIKGMNQDVQEMEALIEEMLGYARLEMAGEQVKFDKCNVSHVIQVQIDKLKQTSDKTINIDVDSNIEMHVNAHYLSRAIHNLIQNADKYGATTICISLSVSDSFLVFSVADDGPGIERDYAQQVFSPFVRIDKSRNKALGGFGLGLAIVKKIAHWHHGECWVERCESLKGAKFILKLPLKVHES